MTPKEAKKYLKQDIKKNTIIYTHVEDVSKSGMSRTMNVYIAKKNKIKRITFITAKCLGLTMTKDNDALRIYGCGMDMGFHLVDSLSWELYGSVKTETGHTQKHRLHQEWV